MIEYVSHQRSQYYFRSLIAGIQLLKLGLMSFIYNSSDCVSNPFPKIGLFLYILMQGSSNRRKPTVFNLFWLAFSDNSCFKLYPFFPGLRTKLSSLPVLDFVPKRHLSVQLRFQKHICNSICAFLLPTSSASALPPQLLSRRNGISDNRRFHVQV